MVVPFLWFRARLGPLGPRASWVQTPTGPRTHRPDRAKRPRSAGRGWADARAGTTVAPMSNSDRGYTIVLANELDNNVYAGSAVPGEFRPLTAELGAEQLAASLISVPAHSDFEQGTGHFHDEIEELYIVTRGALTMRFGDEIETVGAGSIVRVAPKTARSHRNEGDEPVELWAISRQLGHGDSTKIDDFWDASPEAAQTR